MPEPIRILSLGAGVQSTAIALMVSEGKLPPLRCAIFADTQEESGATYRHLDWLIGQTSKSFPTLIRSIGKLGDDLERGVNLTGNRFVSIPCFTKSDEDDREGITRRQCTNNYKLNLIDRTIRREILGLKPRQRFPKDHGIVMVIGLSFDEPGRVLRTRARFANEGKFGCEFPLFDQAWMRSNCEEYLKTRCPHVVPKSACVFCPYHNNLEWIRLRDHDPEGWKRALHIDRALRVKGNVVNRNMDKPMFLHRTCQPLEQVDLGQPEEKPSQLGLGFARECSGMCGV